MSLTLVLPRERVWMRASAPMMGTVAEVLIDGDASMVRAAFARLRSLESILTRFRPDSDLNQLHTRRGEWVRVSPELFDAFVWSDRMYRETRGLFDPTIRNSLESSGYSSTFSHVVDDHRALDPPIPAPGFDSVDIDRATRSVRIALGVSVDLGGVGKGLCADIVARELVADGARSAYVSLGGDIHVVGEPPETGFWQVPLVHPVSAAIIAEHHLVSGGLVMSTVSMRAWKRGGETVHHIIDPRSGRSTTTDVVAVAVAARSAARAEALAKAAIVLGADDGAAFLASCDVTAWVITGKNIVAVEEFSCSR
jgi:thiamine biosynthesis lipoprotein